MSEPAEAQQALIVGNVLARADELVAHSVFAAIGRPPPTAGYQALGFMAGDRLGGGVVFHSLQLALDGAPNSCEISIAIMDRRSLTRGAIRAMFRYPFLSLRCRYVWSGVRRRHKEARELAERLGGRFKCIIEDGDPKGGDMAIYYMHRKHCRWL